MPSYSLAMDLIALAMVVFCALYYARRGFVWGIFSLLGTLVALVAAYVVARQLAPGIFDAFFRPGLEGSVVAAMEEYGFSSVGQLIAAMAGVLPQALIDSVLATLSPAMDVSAGNVAQQVVAQVMQPVVVPFIMAIVFFVLFGLLRAVLRLLRGLVGGLANMPIIGTANRLLGGAMGVVIALLYVYLGLAVIWAYDLVNPGVDVAVGYFGRSLAMRLLSPLNIFA